MSSLYAGKALLPSGWADAVRLTIADGRIQSVTAGVRPAREDGRAGIVIPGFSNAHSHAFQRALVGRTEQRSSAGRDNFWTWRNEMYRLAGAIDAAAAQVIARQVFNEMLCSGYTTVAEFHYLHHATSEAIVSAAEQAGIRLALIPVLYERGGFDAPEPDHMQRLFVRSCDDFVSLYEHAKRLAGDCVSLGVGIHSLRAVTKESVDRIAELARSEQIPLHIHIAEQQREVDECLSHYKTRPVRWLLNRCDVDENWCLVHATHIEPDEVRGIAESAAVVCLCPSTEGNLGDGVFPLPDFLSAGGCIAIGSDSHVTVDPFEELRWLEYGQRVKAEARNVSVADGEHSGTRLVERVAQGGALACGRRIGTLEVGAMADLLVLDESDPILAGHGDETLLDALVFSGYPVPVERVMVHGEWCVVDGRHVGEAEASKRYRRVVEGLR